MPKIVFDFDHSDITPKSLAKPVPIRILKAKVTDMATRRTGGTQGKRKIHLFSSMDTGNRDAKFFIRKENITPSIY
jgi:hypothetical protein